MSQDKAFSENIHIFTMDGTENNRGGGGEPKNLLGGGGWILSKTTQEQCLGCCHVPEGSKSIVASWKIYNYYGFSSGHSEPLLLF